MELSFTVNGTKVAVDVPVGTTLLQVLRDELGLTGAKEVCTEGECGACTVIVDGRPLDACIYAAHAAEGAAVTTVEGLADGDRLSSLQAAFVEAGSVQCGFCTPGFLVMATHILSTHEEVSEDRIRRDLVGNLCRCTGYAQIVDAVLAAGRRP